MQLVFHKVAVSLYFCIPFFIFALRLPAQQSPDTASSVIIASVPVANQLPDAPAPQIQLAGADAESMPTQATPQQPASNPAPTQGSAQSQSAPQQNPPSAATPDGNKNSATQNSSSSQNSAQQTQPSDQEQTKEQKQREEINEEEHQRVLGIAPNFNLTYRHDAVPLTAGQKIDLAFRTSIDPFTFAAAFMVAGYHEALDEDTGFGWGAEGYFKRSGAAYLDSVDGAMIGNGFLPALLRQDPRYFRLGQGTATHRVLYAVATNFICKGDNGHWQPNISNVGGNIIAGALSNLYYPSQNSGWGQTIGNGMIVTVEGGFGSLFDEFWPDISRKFLHRDPTHGLDAQAQAEYAAQKQQKEKLKQEQKQGETQDQNQNKN
jgi:hypothetical protein